MVILLIAILCLVGGFYMGRMTAPEPESVPSPDHYPAAHCPEDRAETERLRQEQRAFSMIMGYSADVAYGLRQAPSAAYERE